jgi:transcription factor SPT20
MLSNPHRLIHLLQGCLIVELRDYRPRDNIDDFISSRVVLQPNSETMWADICHMNQKAGNKWTEQDALEVEARILASRSSYFET